MRVEILCPSRELFGSDRSAVRLATVIRSLGAEVWLTAPAGRPERGLAALAAGHGVELREAPLLIASSHGLHGAAAPLQRSEPSGADVTIYNSAAVLARPGAGGVSVLTLREWLKPTSLRHRLLCALHARRARALVSVSSPVERQWRRCTAVRLPRAVIPNWLDGAWLEPVAEGPRGGVLFVGRLSSWKGQLVLAEAFERAFAGLPGRPSLTFLGAEEAGSPFHRHAEELRARCARNGGRLLSRTSDPRGTFRAAALVVVPSMRPEPFGNVILEGLASGCRVISFPGGGVDDLAPRFPGALEVVERGVEPLARALRSWWGGGGPAQTPAERTASTAALETEFTATAAGLRWREVLGRLQA